LEIETQRILKETLQQFIFQRNIFLEISLRLSDSCGKSLSKSTRGL